MEFWKIAREKDKPVFSDTYEEQEQELAQNIQLSDFRNIRQQRAGDIHRPLYHYQKPNGTTGDPNGLCFWEGRWHLFYQAIDSVPKEYQTADGCAPIHWGHIVSEDMIHWRDLPYAMYPQVETHCFSGGTYVDEENHRVIAAYYGHTGYDPETGYRCGTVIATSSDPLLLNWTKVNDGNPVIPDKGAPNWTQFNNPPVIDKPYQVFDNYIWKENGVYYLLNAGHSVHPVTKRRFREEYLFRCTDDDLLHWEYIKPFLTNDTFQDAGDDGACPYFVPIGNDKRLLIHFTHRVMPKYLLGDYDNTTQTFRPFNSGRFSSGYWNLVAPCAYPCADKSAILIFHTYETYQNPHWFACFTLPRRLYIGGHWNDELFQEPYGDYSSLHKDHKEYKNFALTDNVLCKLPDAEGTSCHIEITIKADQIPKNLEIEVLRSPGGEETTKFTFYKNKGGDYSCLPYAADSVISLDSGRSSSNTKFAPLPPDIASVPIEDNEDLHLQIFVDRSIVEVFANRKTAVTQRVYPFLPDSTGIYLHSRGRDCVVDSIDFWTMGSIYE